MQIKRSAVRPWGAMLIMPVAVLLGVILTPRAQAAGVVGKVQGRIVATDNGEPVGFADILLIPADTTLHKVGALSNADGTFLIEAPPGVYTIQVRALSYATKRVEGIKIEAGGLVPFNAALEPEAIQQKEIVVEAKARRNTEASMLAARKKAAAVGDAVSAEQIRRAPDKNAGEVLRRVTGLSISDDKYVFVRGLGERYSSTEVDGVRVASPEQNKRVFPLDLVPANLLENIVVQKTYTADRPGEFGGGDVQVHTRDFPGARTFSFGVLAGSMEDVTFQEHRTYPGSSADIFGFGAASRGLPSTVPVDQSLNEGNRAFDLSERAAIARSFRNVWSPTSAHTLPSNAYTLGFGDEIKILGHPLGLIGAASLARWFTNRNESQRGYRSTSSDTLYSYNVDRSTESVQLGSIAGLSYRLTPRHSLHLRGLFTNSADDEVRVYEGIDYPRDVGRLNSDGLVGHRDIRLLYVQRSILSGSLEGQHEIPRLLGMNFDWKLTRSRATRQQPDRREVTYDHKYYYQGDTLHWVIGSQGSREFGELHDNGTGAAASATIPYKLGSLGRGKVAFGYDGQEKKRDNYYRRFDLIPTRDYNLWEMTPDSLFAPQNFSGTGTSGSISEYTYNDSRFTDNYRATQRVDAGFVSADVPFGTRLRGNFGLRLERGYQDVESFDLFKPAVVLQHGKLDNTDWLPSANLTWSASEAINVRLAASRTLSRPDLNELSPSPSLEYEGGSLVLGNPQLQRARIDNYDFRVESFPSLSEVFAAGFFYKKLDHPIEQVIRGSADQLVYPLNSNSGHNVGVELEARSSLGRIWKPLSAWSLNSNAAFISSEVVVNTTSQNGSQQHPLQGQASYIVNAAIGYASAHRQREMTVLLNATGRRLKALGFLPLPDIYEQPTTSLDATAGQTLFGRTRVKFFAKNLLNPEIRVLQGSGEVSSYHAHRSYALALTFGS